MPRLILRTGIDLLEIKRLEEITPSIRTRFLKRVFTAAELEQSKDSNPTLAGLFCVKESVAKALGCGIGPGSWQDIETLADLEGAPMIILHGHAARLADSLGLTTWTVSITHTHEMAAATVTAAGFESE
jgi:holo-[acyl-carrier protein] synthase